MTVSALEPADEAPFLGPHREGKIGSNGRGHRGLFVIEAAK